MYSNNYGNKSLFSGRSFHEYQESTVDRIKTQIGKLDLEELQSKEKKEAMVSSLTVTVPKVDWSKTSIAKQQEQVKETYDQIWGHASHKVTVCTFEAPFTGDAHLFDIQPTQRRLSHNEAQANHNGVLVFELTAGDDGEKNKADLKRFQDDIDINLGYLSKDASGYNSGLDRIVSDLFEQRVAELEKHSSKVDSFGVPIKDIG